MKLILSIACLIALPLTTAAVAKPDFNGTWVLDTNRSFSNPPGLEQTMTVVQTDSQITVDAKIKTQQGEQKINETYKLDGAEADFTPPGRAAGSQRETQGHVVTGCTRSCHRDVVTSDSPNGQVTRKTTRKWTLSPDGSVLTVDYYFDDPRGSFEAKRVFIKKT